MSGWLALFRRQRMLLNSPDASQQSRSETVVEGSPLALVGIEMNLNEIESVCYVQCREWGDDESLRTRIRSVARARIQLR